MDPKIEFNRSVQANIDGLKADSGLRRDSIEWLRKTLDHKYSYNYSWMDHPIIQYPQDIQGSSIALKVIAEVHKRAAGHERIMVILDSNHTHKHVVAELDAYTSLVSPDSYCDFEVDEDMEAKLLITVAPGGYLHRH